MTIKIIAFDQSTVKTGYCVMDGTDLVKSGVIDLHKQEDAWIRAQDMFWHIKHLIEGIRPDIVIIEGVALQTNPQVLIKLGQLQGHIMSLSWGLNIPVHIFLPSEWRKILEIKQGKGTKRKELKEASIQCVKSAYPIEASEDEAEAIAIGLAYLKYSGLLPGDKEKKGNGEETKEICTK